MKMPLRFRFGRFNSGSRSKQSPGSRQRPRNARFEMLEDRMVLSPTITGIPITTVNLAAGGSEMFALAAGSSSGVTYTVSSNNASFTPSILPQTDSTLTLTVNHKSSGQPNQAGGADPAITNGTLTFQLFDDSSATAETTAQRIEQAIGSGYYSSATFYRVAHNSATDVFAIQGGTNAGAGTNTAQIDPTMQFTTAGVLAIANSNSGTSDGNDFFVTTEPATWLDGGYTIFGFQTGGATVLSQLADVATTTTTDPSTGATDIDSPINPITFTPAVGPTSPLDGVLLVAIGSGATGSATITVTATDNATQQSTQSQFTVSVTPPPVLATVPDLTGTTAIPGNTGSASYTGASFNLASYVTPGSSNTLTYGAIENASTSDMTVTASQAGVVTIVPNVGVAGTFVVEVGVNDGQNSWVTQNLEVTVLPVAPSLTFSAPAGQSSVYTNLDNSSPAKELSFNVTNVVAGFTVNIYADGSTTPIGSAPVPTGATSVSVPTNGTAALSAGSHTFTAQQEWLQDPVPSPLTDNPVDVIGPVTPTSSAAQVTVDTTGPVFTTNTATVIKAYDFTIQATDAVPLVYSLVNPPAGMSINASTGAVTWVLQSGQSTQQSVEVRAADDAGNSTDATYSVDVTGLNQPVYLPTGSGNAFTVRRNGANVQVVNDKTHAVLFTQALTSDIPLEVVFANGQADQVTINFAVGGTFSLPNGLSVQGGSSPGQNVLVVQGTAGADTFVLGNGTITADGLTTTFADVSLLRLKGGLGNNTFSLPTSSTNVAVVAGGGTDTLDFSGVSGGTGIGTAAKPFSLALEAGQAQSIAPWGSYTLALTGSIANLTGSPYNDFLTGNAANNIIRGDGGNDMIYGGGGNDVLIGGSGIDPTKNQLHAGPGNNLLIAGTGTASLYGGKGNDMLIGGSTSYDADTAANDAALASLVKMGSVRCFFAGKFLWNLAGASSYASLSMGTTVQDSGAHDLLYGGGGIDWYLPGANGKWWR
jgi:cyclophilin family peptidyl-prolyl cis-trans isomerase